MKSYGVAAFGAGDQPLHGLDVPDRVAAASTGDWIGPRFAVGVMDLGAVAAAIEVDHELYAGSKNDDREEVQHSVAPETREGFEDRAHRDDTILEGRGFVEGFWVGSIYTGV